MDPILKKIHKAAENFLLPLSLEETYTFIVKEAIKLVKAQYGSIFLMEQGRLNRVYASSPVLHQVRVRNRGTTYKTFKTKKAEVIDTKFLEKIHPQFKRLGVKSIISIPLVNQSKSVGVLSLQSTHSEHFNQETLNVLRLFGSFASLAIRKTQLYDEVTKALEARDLFISMAAHELRTPITTISGYTQLLSTKLSGSDAPESRWVEELLIETTRLTSLVNELLEVERIKTGQLNYVFHQNSLRRIIERVIANFRLTHPENKIIFNDLLEVNDIVICDFGKLIQVLDNLLENAAKFSSSEKEILITLKDTKGNFVITVKDQGLGILKKEQKQIFEKFQRGSNQSKEGMGLGLFLVKNILAQHHGDIKINSNENKGTMIEIKLPKMSKGK